MWPMHVLHECDATVLKELVEIFCCCCSSVYTFDLRTERPETD